MSEAAAPVEAEHGHVAVERIAHARHGVEGPAHHALDEAVGALAQTARKRLHTAQHTVSMGLGRLGLESWGLTLGLCTSPLMGS